MAQLDINLRTITVRDKNEWTKDEAYLWCFGILVDRNTLAGRNFVLPRKPDQGNLGGGMKKGETRSIPAAVGRVTTAVNPISLGGRTVAVGGVVALAWEEDNTSNSKVVLAYNDSITVMNAFIGDRVRQLNVTPPTQAEINALTSDLRNVIAKRFRAAVHWYNPFSWDPDDFIGFNQTLEVLEGSPLSRSVAFTFKGSDAEYRVDGDISYTP